MRKLVKFQTIFVYVIFWPNITELEEKEFQNSVLVHFSRSF